MRSPKAVLQIPETEDEEHDDGTDITDRELDYGFDHIMDK